MKQIILASTSPRRKELMEKLGVPFVIKPSEYEEDMKIKLSPRKLAKFLSLGKAKVVAKNNPNSIIIGADTFVVLGQNLLGKPHNELEAKVMLKKISGKTLSIITGLAILDSDTGKVISQSVETKIFIKKLSRSEIDNYIKTKEPLDKAGAFAIQGVGSLIVKKISGDYLGAVGLPLRVLAEGLKKFGIVIL